MSPEEFQEEVHTLIKQKKAADVTLDEEAARNWSEIVSREYLFDRHEKDIVILETLDGRKAVMDIAKQLTDEQAPSWKKLSVQIVGNKNGGESKDSGEEVSEGDMDCSADPDGKFGYDYAKIDEGDKREFITNVKEFCQSMECYPVVRIIK